MDSALLQDFPYELYWHDKSSTGGAGAGFECDTGIDGEGAYLTLRDQSIAYSFAVAADYSATGVVGTYQTRPDLASVHAAAQNAAAVVGRHASESDYGKLDSYRAEICDMTSYNDAAAGPSSSIAYGDPWQLVWVFDGDDSTEVVCEGYAKAFKYLCDLSEFANPSVSCYLAEGVMRVADGSSESIGEHMWNVVSVNGRSYLVDVTNCDSDALGSNLAATEGGSGSEPGTGLFMRGSDTVALASAFGSDFSAYYGDGYRVAVPGRGDAASGASAGGSFAEYYYEIESSRVIAPSALALAAWDYPTDPADGAAASAVEAEIAAIGETAAGSPSAVSAARDAYDALTDPQKALVSNLAVLESAEAALGVVPGDKAVPSGSNGADLADDAAGTAGGGAVQGGSGGGSAGDSDSSYLSAPVKTANGMEVKASAKSVKSSKLRKKAVKVSALKVSGASGEVTFKNASAKKALKRFKVATATGKVTVPKGTKAGTYKLKVLVSAAGDATHEPAAKTVVVKIRVK